MVQKRGQTSTACPNATTGYTGALQANVTYDPLGRLFQVDKGTAGTTTVFLYDGDALVAEYNSTGATLLARYVHGSNAAADDPLVWYTYTSGVQTGKRFLHADHLGSIVAMTNGNAAVSLDRYDEYGIPGTDSTGTVTNTGRFQYTGQIYIPELGMYYYKARIYSPRLGRFLQTDPVGYEGGINIYEYADDDPVDHSDPSGNCLDNCPVGSGDAQADRLTRNAELGLDANCKSFLNPAAGVSIGIGGSLGYTSGFGSASGTFGTMFDNKGHSSSFVDTSANVGRANSAGRGANAGITVSIANGHVSDQRGRFNTLHGQLGPVTVTAFNGTNKGPQVYGVSVTVGPGAGASGGVGPSNTTLIATPKTPINFPTIKPGPACNRDVCM